MTSPDVAILVNCPTVVIRLAIFEVYRSTTDGATREQTFVGHDWPLWVRMPYVNPRVQLRSVLYCTQKKIKVYGYAMDDFLLMKEA
jgi:hypothetical protein